MLRGYLFSKNFRKFITHSLVVLTEIMFETLQSWKMKKKANLQILRMHYYNFPQITAY